MSERSYIQVAIVVIKNTCTHNDKSSVEASETSFGAAFFNVWHAHDD